MRGRGYNGTQKIILRFVDGRIIEAISAIFPSDESVSIEINSNNQTVKISD
jgi:hypothetical protein